MAAAVDAVRERDRSERARDADLFAILCNLLGGGKKQWSRADFLPDESGPVDETKAREGLAKYQAAIAATEERYERERAEREAAGMADGEGVEQPESTPNTTP